MIMNERRWGLLLAGCIGLLIGCLALALLRGSKAVRTVRLAEEFDRRASVFVPPNWQPHRLNLNLITLEPFESEGQTYAVALEAQQVGLKAGWLDVLSVSVSHNATAPIAMQFAFQLSGSEDWQSLTTEIDPSPVFQHSGFPLSTLFNWHGRIDNMRLGFAVPSGSSIRIDRIEIASDPDAFPALSIPRLALRSLAGVASLRWPLIGFWLLCWIALIAHAPARPWMIWLVLLVLTLLPRLVYTLLPQLDAHVMDDPAIYKQYALDIWTGQVPRGRLEWGYAWQGTLAILLGPSGGNNEWPARLFLSFAGALTSIPLFEIGRRLMSRRAALLGAFFFAISEEAVRFCGLLFSETFYLLWVVTFVWMCFRLARRARGLPTFFSFALVSAIMILTRSQSAALLPVFWLWILLRRGLIESLRCAAAAAIGLGIAVAVSLPLNLKSYGEPVLLQTGFGSNLMIGNSPNSTGKWVDLYQPWKIEARQSARGLRAVDRAYTKLVLKRAMEAPAEAWQRILKKQSLLFTPSRLDHWFYQPRFPFPLVPFGAYFILCVPGLLIGVYHWRLNALPIGQIVLTYATITAFFYNPRFLLPVIPLLGLYSAKTIGYYSRVLVAMDTLKHDPDRVADPPTHIHPNRDA